MVSKRIAELEGEVHRLREREKETAAKAFDVMTLRREKEEMQQ